jgi:hypothetical protein
MYFDTDFILAFVEYCISIVTSHQYLWYDVI